MLGGHVVLLLIERRVVREQFSLLPYCGVELLFEHARRTLAA